jgi:hypothetical protein
LERRQLYPLTPITPATGVALPLAGTVLFLMPTQTNLLLASAQGSAPLTVDWGFGDPDLLMASFGNNASGAFAASEVTPGVWGISPSLTGPIGSTGQTGRVDTGMAGRARVFDTSARRQAIRCSWTSTRTPIPDCRSTSRPVRRPRSR